MPEFDNQFTVGGAPKAEHPAIRLDKGYGTIGKQKGNKTSYEFFNKIMEEIRNARGEATRRAGLTSDDLYGDSISRATDNIRSNANNTKMVLGRASAAQGGDVTGARGVQFDGIDENANESVGRVVRGYSDKAEAANERSRNRADQLLNMLLGAEGSKLGIMNNNYWRNRELDLQRKQANRQLAVDTFGTILNIGSNSIGGE